MFHCSRRCGRTKKRFSGLLTAHTLDTTQRIILQAMMNRPVDDKSQHNPFAYHEMRKTKSTKTDENLDSFDARMTEKGGGHNSFRQFFIGTAKIQSIKLCCVLNNAYKFQF